MENRKSLNPFTDKQVESVDFVFENCESFRVPADGIDRMMMSDIRYSFDIHPNGLSKWTEPGETSCWAYVDYVSVILNEKGMNIISDWAEMFDDAQVLKDRIEGNDITHFDFNFSDGTNLYIGVPWEDGKSEYDNKYQHNTIKEKMTFIDISKDINEKELEEDNEEYYKFETFDLEEENKEPVQLRFNNDFTDIEPDVVEINDFGYDVPNYVEAALNKIDAELDRVMWNIHQQEYSSPFSNSGNEYKDDIFEAEAYDWDEDSDQEYNFKWRDYKIRWYKYCGRGMEANRYMSPQECAEMLDECLADISGLDIDEDDLFGEMPTAGNINSNCIQCGKPADKILESGVGACKECLDELGKEQNRIREEIENSLFEFGFDNYEDVCNIIETFEDIIEFIQNNSSVDNLRALLNCLNASKTVMQLQNHLLSKEKEEEILKKFEEFRSNL